MSGPLISSKKIELCSQYNHFDLLPIKKFHECNIRIPQTILLQKGYIKDWIFNSHKINNHPILKKRKQNLSTFAVVKSFCVINGYFQTIQGCTNILQIKQRVKQAIKEQKDYDFIRDKKVIEIVTVSNQVLVMNLIDFLDYVSQNKYSQQSFYQKWKMIQQKVSFTKIDEYYKVQSYRHNHVIENKCQKIISVNTTQAGVHSTQIQDDPYKKSSPSKNFQIAQTKNLQGYKFFDTFLNKKFFQMSGQLIQFIQKNMKCLVESVVTKFVINKQRQPYLISIQQLQIKPAKKIADMKQFQMAKQKGFVKVEQYQRCLDIYIHQNMQKNQGFQLSTPLSQRKKRCKGKVCKIPLQQVSLPPLLQQKLKIPSLSISSRVVPAQLRDAVMKRKRRVIQKLIQNKVINSKYQFQDESSEYQTQGQQDITSSNKQKVLKTIKVCQNCYIFYFHVNRFYDMDMYANLVQKKVPMGTTNANLASSENNQLLKLPSERALTFASKQQIKARRNRTTNNSPIKQTQAQNRTLNELATEIIDKKQQQQLNQRFQIDIKPITNNQNKKQVSSQKNFGYQRSKSNPKNTLQPLKAQKDPLLNKTQKILKSDKKLPSNSKSKVKLDPITQSKQAIAQNSLNTNLSDAKGYRVLALAKLSQHKLQSKSKSKTMHAGMLGVKFNRPQNHSQAMQQLLKKLSILPGSSQQQLMHYAKKYYKDNLPQPIDRRSYSTYYQPHLYQFMSTSPISIHPKRRIKKRPEMSLKRLSQLTDYPQIVSRSQFIFDTLIVNEQTTIPFCVITTKVVNPQNLKSGQTFQNIFIINDIFDCFIEHISVAKQLLEEDEVYNKRIILFNYPGQSHTIYNRGNSQGYFAYFCQVFDKLVFRLSSEKNQMKIINLQKDNFKFCGFGLGGNLLSYYLSAYSRTFCNRIISVMLVNSFMQFPKRYKEIVQSLLELFKSNQQMVSQQAYLYYNKAINSEQTKPQQMQHKAGLNPIRVEDRIYLLQCILNQIKQSESTTPATIQPEYFQQQDSYQVSIIYGKINAVVPKQSAMEFLTFRNNAKMQIQNRVFIQIGGGHDIFADNYEDIFRIITLFARK